VAPAWCILIGVLTKDAIRLSEVRRLAETGEARQIRLRARLSTVHFARVVGVTHPTILRWERGQRRPNGEAALRYLDLLTALTKAGTP
jgi:DNA-binding transcriptional regulator YiaG